MAADDELPRGLHLSSQTSGVAPSVTFPATPGISWVLTHADLTNCELTGVASLAFLQINGVNVAMSVTDPATSPSVGATATYDEPQAFPVNTAVTVTSSTGGDANSRLVLNASAYPI